MKVLFIAHADFEKPGYIETWAKNNGYVTQEVHPYKGESLPKANSFDFLVVMGGPQSPLQMEEAPYLMDEIQLIKAAIEMQKPIVGFCLGAQLIGEALGAKTERSPNREVGMYPIELLETAKNDPIFQQFPSKINVMHWHSDMPGLTNESVLLARSEGCPRQVVRYSDKIYGFQCHLELTKDLVEGMIKNCPDDLRHGKYISTADEMLKVNYSEINSRMHLILDAIISSSYQLTFSAQTSSIT